MEMTEIALGGLYDITAKVLVVVSRSHTSQLERLDELLDHSGAGSVVAGVNARRHPDRISLSLAGGGGLDRGWGVGCGASAAIIRTPTASPCP